MLQTLWNISVFDTVRMLYGNDAALNANKAC